MPERDPHVLRTDEEWLDDFLRNDRDVQVEIVHSMREAANAGDHCRFRHHPQQDLGNLRLILAPDWKQQLTGKSGSEIINVLEAWLDGRAPYDE